ncbi:hypothetical protein CY35_05G136400 [Sphagnum magellanicum]|nr:hypothetical protein CY35_05G136400 [Sphagnum magellanicum]
MESMESLVGVVGLLLLLCLIPLFLWRRSQPSTSPPLLQQVVEAEEEEIAVPLPMTAGRGRSSGISRMRRRPAAGASSQSVPEAEPSDDGNGEEEGGEDGNYYVAKGSKKKASKKHEREARREAEAYARDMKKEKQERQANLRRQKDEEREAEERHKEEAAQEQKAKEEAAALEEFDKWKGAFSVDTEGTAENDVEEEGQGLLVEFVEYIKKHKCVALEDLAAEFNLRTQDCITRVLALEQMGRISGVMDDRGKFIYISPEEMKAVADYIKRLGRVSISHLASKSNEFIDLEPKSLPSDEIGFTLDADEPSKLSELPPPISVA